MKSIKAMLCLCLTALVIAACGQQSAPPATSVAATMSVQMEPEHLAVGSTTLVVTLKDAYGAPLDGATVQAHGSMDHHGMAPVDAETRESSGGAYRLPFEWTMGGGWIVTVTAHLPNGSELVETFNVFVEAVSSESIINR
jgi:hypothetical protein